jgi:osmotically-inducible protein OsmY
VERLRVDAREDVLRRERNVVTLSGEVSSAAERLAIVGAIRGMPGIAAVENRIQVR